jgi:hypothetical protein
MSNDPDRIPVPANGRRGPSTSPAGDAADGPASSDDPRVVLSPAQLAVGFSVLVSVVLLLVGRRRRRG